MDHDYKTSKEAFVSGMTGSSVGHINMVSLSSLVSRPRLLKSAQAEVDGGHQISIALYSALKTRLPPSKHLHFLGEVLLLVGPLLASVTVFANAPGKLCLILLVPTLCLLLLPRRETGPFLPSSLTHSRTSSRDSTTLRDANTSGIISIPPLPALTTYRSHMLLLTFLCILAVDFPVFPRSLAKCETFGASMVRIRTILCAYADGL